MTRRNNCLPVHSIRSRLRHSHKQQIASWSFASRVARFHVVRLKRAANRSTMRATDFSSICANQAQDFSPVVVAAVAVEEGDQSFFGQRLGDIEPVHTVGRAEVFQKRAMYEAVTVRANETEYEIAHPEVLEHGPGGSVGLVEVLLPSQIIFDQGLELRTGDHIPLQSARAGLHERRDRSKNVALLRQPIPALKPGKSFSAALRVPLI